MKNKKSIMFTVLALSILMLFSISVFSQGDKPKEKEGMCESMMGDEALMKDCMGQMENKDMKAMCNRMMDKMKENPSMCCKMMVNDKTDGQEMNDEHIEGKNKPDADPDVKQKELLF